MSFISVLRVVELVLCFLAGVGWGVFVVTWGRAWLLLWPWDSTSCRWWWGWVYFWVVLFLRSFLTLPVDSGWAVTSTIVADCARLIFKNAIDVILDGVAGVVGLGDIFRARIDESPPSAPFTTLLSLFWPSDCFIRWLDWFSSRPCLRVGRRRALFIYLIPEIWVRLPEMSLGWCIRWCWFFSPGFSRRWVFIFFCGLWLDWWWWWRQ